MYNTIQLLSIVNVDASVVSSKWIFYIIIIIYLWYIITTNKEILLIYAISEIVYNALMS